MKRLYEMAQGLALAGFLYAATVGLTVALAGRANADGPQTTVCISVYSTVGDPGPPPSYLGCSVYGNGCSLYDFNGQFLYNGVCGNGGGGVNTTTGFCGCFVPPPQPN